MGNQVEEWGRIYSFTCNHVFLLVDELLAILYVQLWLKSAFTSYELPP